MSKIKIGPSFLLLVVICLISNQFILLINYLMALLFHELAHFIVAFRRGYELKLFKLDISGLSIELNESLDEQDNFAVNIAGPACNLFLCLICFAIYWIIPQSVKFLNTFCMASFALAIFNMLPIYPLDGGKIFRALIKSDKAYKIVDRIIRYSFCVLFFVLFIFSCFNKTNFMLIVVSLFFLISKPKKQITFSIFKTKRKLKEKVKIIKINENMTIFSIIKLIKKSHYTIFYCNTISKKFIDEDEVVEISIKNPLYFKIKDIKY